MKITAWRIFKPKHTATAFTGEGAKLFGGRWNSKGVAVVYTASSRSLAALELLVHLGAADILSRYSVCSATFDEQLVEPLEIADLPSDWRADPAPAELSALGDEWARSARSVALQAPSVIVPGESNYLLNPLHPDFHKVVIGDTEPFEFDPRLAK